MLGIDLRTALLVGGAIALPSLHVEAAQQGIEVPICALSSHKAALAALDATPVAGIQSSAGTTLAINRFVQWMQGIGAVRGFFEQKKGIAKVDASEAASVLERCLAALDAGVAVDADYKSTSTAIVQGLAQARLERARSGDFSTADDGLEYMLTAYELLDAMDEAGAGRCPGGGSSGGITGDEGGGSDALAELPGRLFDAGVFLVSLPFLATLKMSEAVMGAAGNFVGNAAGSLAERLVSSPTGLVVIALGLGAAYIVVRPYLPGKLGGGA